MRFVRILCFFVIIALLEIMLVPLPFTFIALFLWQQLYSKEEALVLAFLCGFLFDIFFLQTLGTTSMLFMTLLFAIVLYKRKYQAHNIIFVGVAVFLSILVLEFFLRRSIVLLPSIISVAIAIILARAFSTSGKQYESWYRIS